MSSTLGAAAKQSGQGEGVRHLQVLLEVARALNAATVLEEVLDIVLQAAVRLVGSDRGYLVLLAGDGGRSAVVSYPPGSAETAWVAQSSILDRAIGGRETVVVGPGDGQSKSMVARGISSALAAPLLVARHPMGRGKDASFVATLEVIGGILVERRQAGAVFSRDELAVFESLAADAALAIDSARLYRETRDKAKIEHEMALARTIQAAMLREPPQVGFAEIHALSQPARSVGGDLYFAGVRPDGAVVTAVGDVSGKGVAAALIMAMAQGLLALVTDLGLPFDEMVSALDRNLATFNPGNRFLTLGACLLHPDGHLAAVNGGHCPSSSSVATVGWRRSIRPARSSACCRGHTGDGATSRSSGVTPSSASATGSPSRSRRPTSSSASRASTAPSRASPARVPRRSVGHCSTPPPPTGRVARRRTTSRSSSCATRDSPGLPSLRVPESREAGA